MKKAEKIIEEASEETAKDQSKEETVSAPDENITASESKSPATTANQPTEKEDLVSKTVETKSNKITTQESKGPSEKTQSQEQTTTDSDKNGQSAAKPETPRADFSRLHTCSNETRRSKLVCSTFYRRSNWLCRYW